MDITDEVSIRHVSGDDPNAVDPDEIEGPGESRGRSAYPDVDSIPSSVENDLLMLLMGLDYEFDRYQILHDIHGTG